MVLSTLPPHSHTSRSAAQRAMLITSHHVFICSADGSTHTESNKLYRKVKHRYRPNLSPRQRPTANSGHDQAALAASAEARGATHRARPPSPSRLPVESYLVVSRLLTYASPGRVVYPYTHTRRTVLLFLYGSTTDETARDLLSLLVLAFPRAASAGACFFCQTFISYNSHHKS